MTGTQPVDESNDPSSAELLAIIERARAEREAREAMDRYWAAIVKTCPKPSEWPCTSNRECMASQHHTDCPTRIAELIKGTK